MNRDGSWSQADMVLWEALEVYQKAEGKRKAAEILESFSWLYSVAAQNLMEELEA